jgi:hypothetical protein
MKDEIVIGTSSSLLSELKDAAAAAGDAAESSFDVVGMGAGSVIGGRGRGEPKSLDPALFGASSHGDSEIHFQRWSNAVTAPRPITAAMLATVQITNVPVNGNRAWRARIERIINEIATRQAQRNARLSNTISPLML